MRTWKLDRSWHGKSDPSIHVDGLDQWWDENDPEDLKNEVVQKEENAKQHFLTCGRFKRLYKTKESAEKFIEYLNWLGVDSTHYELKERSTGYYYVDIDKVIIN